MYKRIVSDYGYPVGNVKSSLVKELLINEYHEAIGYRSRSEINKREWAFDVRGSGDYIVAAMSSLCISNEQLLQNMASRLSEKVI